jgi:Sulfotransferase domain.
MDYVRIWEKWIKEKNVLIARYEDLLTNYDAELTRLVAFLKVDESNPEARKVIETYRPGAIEGQQGLHFYKGRIGRFREAYSAEERDVLAKKFGPALKRMGYEM